jgi:non-specific serine/threonine protein kinase
MTKELWRHQREALDLSQQIANLALFMEVGTGKTRATIEILRYRCAANGRLLKTLIFVPKIVCTNWQREIKEYSKIHPYDVHVLLGTGTQRIRDFKKYVCQNEIPTKSQIIITNYESVQMDGFFSLLQQWQPEVIIADECHRLKNPESKRAQRVIQLADMAMHKYALTGTPILNSAMDIFNIYRFLDGGETFGKSFWKFRAIWFEDENAGWAGQANYFPKYVPRPQTYAELNRLIYKKAVRAVKAECLDLPPFVRKEVHADMGKEQAKLYKDLKEQYIAYIDDKLKTEPRAVVAQLAVTKALRLMQIVTGYAKADDGSIYKIKDNPRLDALEELLEELTPNHKVIVWSVFHENYEDIKAVCNKLNIGFGELHGKISQKERESAISNFRSEPSCRVLIANQAAGGIGINLIESDVSIYYSKNFSLEQDIQSEGRNYRGGSERHTSVTRIDIVALNTIDELVTQALATKQEIAGKVLDWREQL